MKPKDMHQKIEAAANRDLKDMRVTIDLNSIDFAPAPSTAIRFPRRNVWLLMTSISVLVIALVTGLVLILSPGEVRPLQGEAEVISFQALTALSLLESYETESDVSQPYFGTSLFLSESTEPLISDNIQTISRWIEMLEVAIGSKDDASYTLMTSDLSTYDHLIRFTSIDLLGEAHHQDLYYSMVLSTIETEIHGLIITENGNQDFHGIYHGPDAEIISTLTLSIDSLNEVYVENISHTNHPAFRYILMEHGEITHMSTVTLFSDNRSVRAEVDYSEAGSTVHLVVQRIARNGLSIQYQLQRGTASEHGQIDVSLILDGATGKHQYRFIVEHNPDAPKNEYQNPRRRNANGNNDNGPPWPPGNPNHTTEVSSFPVFMV
jgi:hypothetical protein